MRTPPLPGTLPPEAPEHGRPHPLSDVLLPGAVAGTLGAVGMAALAVAVAAVAGAPERPLLLVAGVLHRGGMPRGAGWALLGAGIHLAVAVGLATLFAALLPRRITGTPALALGTLYALGLSPVMFHLVLPWACPPLWRGLDPVALALVHLPFGAALAVLPSVRGLLAQAERLRRQGRALRRAVLG